LRRYGITVNAVAPGALTRMTEDLGMGRGTDEDKAALHPRWIAPIVTWLASTESAKVTGRVFEATGSILGVAEGWHRGPVVKPVDDPTKIAPLVEELLRTVRKNAGMDGKDLD
jgi:NAD(P)-dependent dehydrogenase (short-subunit alcohol dehydrogenase family)